MSFVTDIFGGLFGGDESPAQAPAPAPLPPAPGTVAAPLPADPAIAEGAKKQRENAATAAQAEAKAYGRRSTMVAGMNIAADEQGASGLLAKSRRAKARELVG